MTDIDPQQLLQHQEDQHEENQRKLDKLLQLSQKQLEWNESIEQKINPMYKVFSNLQSTNSILASILKALILLGSAMVAIGGAWEIIKAFFKH